MIKASRRWCQVGGRGVETRWVGYSFCSKARPLKEGQPLKKRNPSAQDFIRRRSRRLGREEGLGGTV